VTEEKVTCVTFVGDRIRGREVYISSLREINLVTDPRLWLKKAKVYYLFFLFSASAIRLLKSDDE
jgi:hypothetical protein